MWTILKLAFQHSDMHAHGTTVSSCTKYPSPMSQFFADIDVEQSEVRKKPTFKKEASDEEDVVSKKDSRIKTIKQEIQHAEENLNNKSVDKVLRLLQKSNRFWGEVQPLVQSFFEKVLANKKVSQAAKSKCMAFMERFEKEEENVGHGVNVKRKVSVGDEIAAIMSLKDVDDKYRKLVNLHNHITGDAEKFKVLMSELMVLVHTSEKRYLEQIHDLVCQLSDMYKKCSSLFLDGVDLKKLFVQQARTHLGTLLSFVSREEQSIFADIACTLRIHDQEYVDRKILEFKYFHLHDFVENEDSNFKLLYLTKNGMYDSALQYFENNESYLFESEETPVLDALLMLGNWAFYAKKYILAFRLLQRCYYSNYSHCEAKLLILCCVLNYKVLHEKFFQHFIDQLSVLEKNPLLLESECLRNEIFRAFFLLMSYDQTECENILKKAEPELDCHDLLQKCVQSLVEELKKQSIAESHL